MFATQAQAGSCALDGIRLLALGAEDGRIVLQMPDRALQELATGETLPGNGARLTKLLQAEAVFDLPGAPGQEAQTVRLHKNGTVQCFKASAAATAARTAPRIVFLPIGSENGNDSGASIVRADKKSN